jgi:hypothetical protein
VGEVTPELGGEFKPGVGLDAIGPALTHLGGGRAIKSVVQFDRVEEIGQINERIKLRSLFRGIDNPFPILIRPTCRTHPDHNEPHAKAQRTPRNMVKNLK